MSLASMLEKVANTVLVPLNIKIVRVNRLKKPIKSITRPEKPKFVNVGSGGWMHPLWHTLDKSSDWYNAAQKNTLDYDVDLMSSDPLPFEFDSLEAIFCSHVIEHLPDEQVQHLFNEVFRVVAPGGYFRITCPDIQLIYDAFQRKDSFFMNRFAFHRHYKSRSLTSSFLHCFAAVLTEHHPYDQIKKISDEKVEQIFSERPFEEALDHIVNTIPKETQSLYPSCHLNWFHADKVINMLKIAGFKQSWVSAFGQSRCQHMSDLNFFDKTQPWMSLYVECQK
jgi:predicted SAM-dependent methyltransferase